MGGRASCHQLEMNDIFTVAAPSMETPSTLTGASSDALSQQGQFFNLIFLKLQAGLKVEFLLKNGLDENCSPQDWFTSFL